jgi:hypothetical protein
MSAHLNSYLKNSLRVQSLLALHDSVRSSLTSAVDTSDMLRAGHVLSVSALDTYIHEVVRNGILEIYDGERPVVPGYTRIRISLVSAVGFSDSSANRSVVEQEIRGQHGYLSFQHPDKIADAIRCISDTKLWEEVGSRIGAPAKFVKDRLALIVDRRNKIAHEADVDPTFGTLWPINSSDVFGTLNFIDSVTKAIDEIVSI